MPSAVASRYARALVDVVASPKARMEPHAALSELDAFEREYKVSTDLRNVLLSPAVQPARKRAVIERLASMLPLSPLVKRFLLVILDHRRMHMLSDIREAFEAELDQRLGVVRVDVSSAIELNADQRAVLTDELRRLTGKQPRPQFSLDPALIGGVVARVGSTIYDGSVRGQLEALRQRLVSAD